MYLFFMKNVVLLFRYGIAFATGLIALPFLLFAFWGYNTITVSQTLLSGLPQQRDSVSQVAGISQKAAAQDHHLLGTGRHLLHA